MEIPKWRVEILELWVEYERFKGFEVLESDSDYVKINSQELFRVLSDLKEELRIPSYKFDEYLRNFKKLLKYYGVRYANKYALRNSFRNYVSLVRYRISGLTIK